MILRKKIRKLKITLFSYVFDVSIVISIFVRNFIDLLLRISIRLKTFCPK